MKTDGPERDPAAAIAAVAVPGYQGSYSIGGGGPGPIGGTGGSGGYDSPPRDVLFVLTELGSVYRVVNGGKPTLVFRPPEVKKESER